MPLDAETIARLTAPKTRTPAVKTSTGGGLTNTNGRSTKLIRRRVQYPELIENEYVKHILRSKPCTSRDCGSPSYYTMSGSPLCNLHLIYALVYELDRMKGTKASEDSQPLPALTHTASRAEESSLALSVLTTGEDGDNNYL